MKRHPLFIFAILILSFFHSNIEAQVNGVKYRLIYDAGRDFHDFYIHIVSGTSISPLHRAQFNSTITFVVPTGTVLTVEDRYMPLKNNQVYNGTEPYDWNITSSVFSPAEQPDNDFHYLATSTLGSYYNNLYPGDSVKLFSVKAINTTNECGKGIRLYENGVDPDASMPGMQNADFSQGFTIGGGVQDYLGNLPNLNINQSTITAASLQSTNVNDNVLSVSAGGNGPFIYQWNGPNSFNSSNQNIIIPNIPAALGIYNLTIIGTLQCSYTTNFIVDEDIDSTCRNTTYKLFSQWGNGTWTNFNNNAPGAHILNINNGIAEVTFDTTANGQYHFIFTNEQGVSYRKFVNIIPHTAIKPVMDEIGYVCAASDPIQLKASPSGGVFYGNSINGDSFSPADAGEGDHLIYYEYQDGFCGSTYDTIVVKNYEPNAGPDQEVCAASIHIISGLPVNGKWVASNGNPVGVSWSSEAPNKELISFSDNAAGIYRFIYSTDNFQNCRDTMEFKVKPIPNFVYMSNLCVGSVEAIQPVLPGSWTSSDPAVATITNVGVITAISAGSVLITYTHPNGCEKSFTLTVLPKPSVNISGMDSICVGGTTTLSANLAGTWASSNQLIATSLGDKVTGVSAGSATFIFTTLGGCNSDPLTIEVRPRPTVMLTKSELCLGDTLHLFPNTNGQWVSSNTAVVTSGNFIAYGISMGKATLAYVDSTGCVSNSTNIMILNKKFTLIGDNQVCVGKVISINGVGAIYSTNDPGIATVSNAGLITTVSPGTTSVNCEAFYNTCASDTTFEIIVQEGPAISLNGDSTICPHETTSLLAGSGGTWKVAPGFSNNIATINNAGIVTGISPGFTKFVFIRSSDGCQSNPSEKITVNGKPTVFVNGLKIICINGNTQLFPSMGGSWVSYNPAIATVDNTGLVTGISEGTANFRFTNALTGCMSDNTENITVSAYKNAEIIGSNTLCLGSYARLSPSFGGTWKSNNPSIATVNNTGLVTPIDTGEVTFTFSSVSGNTCVIDSVTPTLSIIEFVPINLEGDSTICINGNTKVSSEAGAIYYSRNGFATVDDKGNITGKSVGKERIYAKIGDCVSRDIIIDIKDVINAGIVGSDTVCLGDTVYLFPNTGGIWSSVLPTIASVNNNGMVLTQQRGKLQFLYTDIISNCESYTPPLNIVDGALVNFSTFSKICVGQEIKFTASNTGVWKSSNPEIASIDIHGNVVALKQGSCSFSFTDDICHITKSSQVITVHDNPILNEANTIFLKKGDTYILNYAKPANIVSSNTNIVAGNSQTGKLTAKAAGAVTLYIVNAAGCISKTITIVVNPANARLVKGIIYADYNANDIYDAGDLPLPGFQVQEKNVSKYYYTNQFGEYYFTLENDETDILFDAKYGQWQESQYVVPIQYNGLPIDINRGFLPKTNATDKAEASLFTSWLRCSSEVFLHAKTFNRGSFPLSGKMVVKVDQRSPIVYANPNFSFKNNNEYEWHFSDMKPGKDLSPAIKIMVPQTLSTTDSLFFEISIVNEEGDVLDEKSYGELIRCSYDPNDKMSSPNRSGEEKHILLKETIDYTIRFQNTGNDTAFYVRIFDDLDKNLDPSSILITGSSHEVKVVTEGHKVSFVFEDIILPDSSRNFLGSQGYVSFQIKAYDQSLQDYELNNTAKIIFDFNDAIITNTVKNTLVEYLPCYHINGSLYQEDDQLIAPAGGQEYHWYDCSTFQKVYEGSDPFYTPEYEQEFYAIIYGQDCRYTTNCVGFITTGLSDVTEDNVTFYPNPAIDKISIQSHIPIKSVEVFDVTGKSCLKTLHKSEIDVSTLHQGYYQIKIETVSGLITRNNFVKNN